MLLPLPPEQLGCQACTTVHSSCILKVTEEEEDIRSRSRLTRTADVRKYSLLGAGKVKMVEGVTLES